MAKTCKFKLFVDNVSDASIKLNNVERNSIEAEEGTLVKWIVSKEGYQSDMGEITLGSSCTITVRLAKANARVKNTYTKIYKDEDGKYVTEQSELTTTGHCLPSSEGQEGKILSVTEGGFVDWVESSAGDLSELTRKVNANTTAITELGVDVDSLEGQLEGAVAQIETKAAASDLEALSGVVETKASASDLSDLAEDVADDKKNLADNYWNSTETSNQIESAVEAAEAALSVTINQKANRATTLAGYNITDAYTKEEIDAKASSFMNYKGQVENTNALPAEAAVGDVYNVKSTGANYCWNGESWDKLSEDIDLSGLMSKEEARAELALKANSADVESALALKANKSELPVVPTNVSAFTNDAGYLTEHQSLEGLATKDALDEEIVRAENAEGALSRELSLKADKNEVDTALAAKLTKSELINQDGSLYNKVINSSNNSSLLFNESDGGGAQFTNNSKNVISYVGVNEDDDNGVCVQIYSKYLNDNAGAEQVKNKGTRLNVNPKGMYYTKGRTNGAFDVSEELATINDVANEQSRAEQAEAALSGVLELKADKSELPNVPVNVSEFNNDAGYLTEHQSLDNLATKAELQDEINRAEAAESLKANQADMEVALNAKLNKSEILTGDGYLYNKVNKADGSHSLIFNESDGGGAQFYNNPANVISYVGVNGDNADGVCVQIYSKYKAEAEGQTENEGTRLNVNPKGMYYTKGKTNGSFDAGDELATKGELNLKATLEDVNSLSDQLRILNDRLSEMSKTNKETVAPIAGEPVALNDATKDYTIESDFDKTLDVVAKSVEIKDATITAAEKLPSPKGVAMLIEASEEVAMKNSTVACDLTGSSNIVEVRNCQYITFRDMVFTGRTYNTIMTGQRSPNQPIKSLTIENCEFREFADHVNIWAANFADNAVVTINNCHFYDSDEQVLALSNETLAKNVTINITNCIIDKCETGDEYEGFILCQDYISKTNDEFETNAMFKNMTINLSNVTLRGVRLTKENFKMGTSAAGQCLYVYGPTLHAYDEKFFPTVNVM